MAKFKQFRYYADNSTLNEPQELSQAKLVIGDFGKDAEGIPYFPISKLGIQTMPGVKFYLNDNDIDNIPVIINNTGIFELDLKDKVRINNLKFDAISLNSIQNNPNKYIIIDIVYGND